MTKAKKTGWFPPEVKPVNVGDYESAIHAGQMPVMTKWDLGVWRWVDTGLRCLIQDRRWRGLAEKPQEPTK